MVFHPKASMGVVLQNRKAMALASALWDMARERWYSCEVYLISLDLLNV